VVPFLTLFWCFGDDSWKIRDFSQMFSQLSRTPDFERSFRVKRCGLYAGVYGILKKWTLQPVMKISESTETGFQQTNSRA